MRSVAFVLFLAASPPALATLAGCEGEPPKTALGYTEDAKRAYDNAMAEYNSHNWLEAQTLFRELKRKYSYSKYARMAELRIADADFEQEKFSEAIREYKDFVHAHRADPEGVAYARSRIAEATYAEIPESFLLPAAEERDQATVVDAYKELKDYLGDYPDAKESKHIRQLLAQVTARLVRHELYVARFYLNKDNYEAAVARVQYALHNYGDTGEPGVTESTELHAEALLLLGTTYLRMHKWGEARQAFEAIVRSYGASPLAVEARNYLEYLKQQGA
ncbi:MAG TPA: outer membrane protein assembly factor BamD [Polyangiaceae bacterium]|jgi:outer membrane protein assembly factor BamD